MPMEFSTTHFFYIVYIVYISCIFVDMVVKFTCSSLRYISQLLITLSGDIVNVVCYTVTFVVYIKT